MRLARGAARAFVLEPAFGPAGKLKTARKGVGRFRVTVTGRAAHAGLEPRAGVSAILELSHQVQRLFALNDPERGITVNVGTIDGGLRPNVVAPEASALVDVRVPTREDAAEVEAAIRGLRPVAGGRRHLEVEGGFGRPPLEPTQRNRALWRRARRPAERLGLSIEASRRRRRLRRNFTSLYTATLDGLGPVGARRPRRRRARGHRPLPERAALFALLLAAPLDAGGGPVNTPLIRASVTRVARLGPRAGLGAGGPRPLAEPATSSPPRSWASPPLHSSVEATDGRMVEVRPGDLVVGALGERAATLEVVGDWREVGDDLRLDGLTRAGVLGRVTSAALGVRHLIVPMAYRGHVLFGGAPLTMTAVLPPAPRPALCPPTVLLIGTSMSAGKTTSAKTIIRVLCRLGLRVAGAKLTGVARYATSWRCRTPGRRW